MTLPPIFLHQLFTRELCAFSGFTLLVYDYLLTLPLEVIYIWQHPWSIVKSLFMVNRYVNLIGQTFIMLEETGYLSRGSRKFCIGFELFAVVFSVFSAKTIRLLFVMRGCAIAGCTRKMALLVNLFYVLYALGVLAFSISWFFRHIYDVQFEYLEEVGMCIFPLNSKTWMFWIVPTFIDCLAIVAVWYHIYQVIKGLNMIYSSWFLHVLAKDAFLFSFAMLFCDLFTISCLILYTQAPDNFLPPLITYPIVTIIGQRAVLNLRQVRTEPSATHDISLEVRQIAALVAQQPDSSSDLVPEVEMEMDLLKSDHL